LSKGGCGFLIKTAVVFLTHLIDVVLRESRLPQHLPLSGVRWHEAALVIICDLSTP
jgi:hypothetical protein